MVFFSDARRCQNSNLGGPEICLAEGVLEVKGFWKWKGFNNKKKQSVFLQFSYDKKPPTANRKKTLTLVI